MANIWQIRGVLCGVQWRMRTHFIVSIFTLILVLLSYHRLDARSGHTFAKIAFSFWYVTLHTFRSSAGDILKNS